MLNAVSEGGNLTRKNRQDWHYQSSFQAAKTGNDEMETATGLGANVCCTSDMVAVSVTLG